LVPVLFTFYIYWQNIKYFLHKVQIHVSALDNGHLQFVYEILINPLTTNDPYRVRTAPLTSKRCILYIYSTNIGTEYFKHGIISTFFPSSKCSLFHNSNVFGSCIIHILYTGCTKIIQNIHGLFIWGREGVKWARDLVSVGKVGRCGLHERSMLLPSYV